MITHDETLFTKKFYIEHAIDFKNIERQRGDQLENMIPTLMIYSANFCWILLKVGTCGFFELLDYESDVRF